MGRGQPAREKSIGVGVRSGVSTVVGCGAKKENLATLRNISQWRGTERHKVWGYGNRRMRVD